jgi:hypothetical protein
MQAQDAFLDLGVQYAHTLAELPMLSELWHRAAAFDPITDKLALMIDPVGGSAVSRLQQAAAARAGGGLGRPGWWRQQQQRHSQGTAPLHTPELV